jgi:aspartate aminotransferase
MAERAAKMRDRGIDVVSLSAGEPDFPTPPPIAAAGIQAIRAGHTRYTAAAGLPALRVAVCTLLARDFDLHYQPTEVLITAGVKPALQLALMVCLDPGQSALVPAPYWTSYTEMIRLAGCTAVVMDPVPDQGFVHDRDQLLQHSRDHGTRCIIVNTPNNPTGVVWTRPQVEMLVEVADYEDQWILSDEIYAHLTYGGAQHVSPAQIEGGKQRTLVASGASKSFAMTGWRLGFLAGPEPAIAAAARIQSQITGNVATPVQYAGIEAFGNDHRAEIARMVAIFDQRRRLVVRRLNELPGIRCLDPRGAFYALFDVRGVLAKHDCTDDVAMAERLLEDAHLALVPGSAFGAPGFLRLSYAAGETVLNDGIDRLARWLG